LELVLWKNGFMKTTIELPDELLTEVKVEAARQKKKLKELFAELVRSGLRAQRRPGPAERRAMRRWIDGWVELGEAATAGLAPEPTASEILAADRGQRERR
jgi:hypothetical protein